VVRLPHRTAGSPGARRGAVAGSRHPKCCLKNATLRSHARFAAASS
jgi:hypothetical protein